jgi:hypothetical protein
MCDSKMAADKMSWRVAWTRSHEMKPSHSSKLVWHSQERQRSWQRTPIENDWHWPSLVAPFLSQWWFDFLFQQLGLVAECRGPKCGLWHPSQIETVWACLSWTRRHHLLWHFWLVGLEKILLQHSTIESMRMPQTSFSESRQTCRMKIDLLLQNIIHNRHWWRD